MDEVWGVQNQQTWTFNGAWWIQQQNQQGDRKNDAAETRMTGTKNETQQTTMGKVDIHVLYILHVKQILRIYIYFIYYIYTYVSLSLSLDNI